MFFARIVLAFVIISCFSCTLAFPPTRTKDDLNKLVTNLLQENEERSESVPSIVSDEIKEDINKDERMPDKDLGMEFDDGDSVAKRMPWYRSADFYNNLKRFGGFDSINHYSNFGKFQKRKDGGISRDVSAAENFSNRLKRQAFDSIHHYSDFGRFSKRSIPRFVGGSSYRSELGIPSWKRRAFDSIHHYSDFGRFSRKK